MWYGVWLQGGEPHGKEMSKRRGQHPQAQRRPLGGAAHRRLRSRVRQADPLPAQDRDLGAPGVHPLPQPQTHLRDSGPPERRRYENSRQYAGTLRRRLHPPHLHPRHQATAEPGGRDNVKLYGPDHVNPPQKARKRQTGRWNFLSGTLRLRNNLGHGL